MDGFVIYIIDTETTGLIPKENDVIEISAIRLTIDENNQTNKEQKTWLLKAINPSTISDEALKVNGHKREDILHLTEEGKVNYREPSEVVAEIELWMMEDGVSTVDRVFAGQNPFFDVEMLQELWKRVNCAETFPFELSNNNRIIDTKAIVILFDICTGRRRLHYNLASLVKAFGGKKVKFHRASEDTMATCDLLLKLIEPIREIVKDKFQNCYPNEDSL